MTGEDVPNPTGQQPQPPIDQTPPPPPREDDGVARPVAPQPEPAPATAQPTKDDEGDKPFVPSKVAKRREIADRFREASRAKIREFDGDVTSPKNLYGEDNVPREEEPGGEPEPVEPQRPPPTRTPGEAERPPQERPQEHELIVRGQRYKMTRDQVIEAAGFSPEEVKAAPWHVVERIARTNMANESLLEQNKARGRELAIREAQLQAPASQQQPEPDRRQQQPAPGKPAASKEDLAELAERLVLGSSEEQAEALDRFGSQIHERALDSAVKTVRAELLGREVTNDSQQAYDAVMREHPDFGGDTPASATFGMHMTNISKMTMVNALRALPESTQVRLAQEGFDENYINGFTDHRTVGKLYRDMVLQGWKLPRASAVINAARNVTLQQLGRTPGQQPGQQKGTPTVTVDRGARKAGLPPQPARAAAPPQTRTQAPQSSVVDPTDFREKAARSLIERRGRPGRAAAAR